MKPDQFSVTLTKQLGARKEGSAFVLPSDAELTLFVSLTGDTLTVPRVTRLEIGDGLAMTDNARGERYVIAIEDVRALRIERGDTPKRDRNAGFGK